MPISVDQKANMKKIQFEKAGMMIEWDELTTQKLKDTIYFLMNDQM